MRGVERALPAVSQRNRGGDGRGAEDGLKEKPAGKGNQTKAIKHTSATH